METTYGGIGWTRYTYGMVYTQDQDVYKLCRRPVETNKPRIKVLILQLRKDYIVVSPLIKETSTISEYLIITEQFIKHCNTQIDTIANECITRGIRTYARTHPHTIFKWNL